MQIYFSLIVTQALDFLKYILVCFLNQPRKQQQVKSVPVGAAIFWFQVKRRKKQSKETTNHILELSSDSLLKILMPKHMIVNTTKYNKKTIICLYNRSKNLICHQWKEM